MKWILFTEGATAINCVVDVTSYAQAVARVEELQLSLPVVTDAAAAVGAGDARGVVVFEGQCFQSPSAPLLTVLSEDSFQAFVAAVGRRRQQAAPPPPRLKVSRLISVGGSTNSSKTTSSEQQQQEKRINSRLNSIKRAMEEDEQRRRFEGGGAGGGVDSAVGAADVVRGNAGSLNRWGTDSTSISTAAATTATTSTTTAAAPAAAVATSAGVRSPPSAALMVWGAQVGRGAPLVFNCEQPPKYAALVRQIRALLLNEQPVDRLTFRTEDSGGVAGRPGQQQQQRVEIDIEDDDDIVTLAATIADVGIEQVTVVASEDPKRAAAAPAADLESSRPSSGVELSGSSAAVGPVISLARLKREMKHLKQQQQLSSGATSSSLLTSPIKFVDAPSREGSPVPPTTSLKSSQSQSKSKPPASLVAQLD